MVILDSHVESSQPVLIHAPHYRLPHNTLPNKTQRQTLPLSARCFTTLLNAARYTFQSTTCHATGCRYTAPLVCPVLPLQTIENLLHATQATSYRLPLHCSLFVLPSAEYWKFADLVAGHYTSTTALQSHSQIMYSSL